VVLVVVEDAAACFLPLVHPVSSASAASAMTKTEARRAMQRS